MQVKVVAANRRERINQLVAQNADILLFLKEKGALLNTISPENLLSKDDFVFYRVRKS